MIARSERVLRTAILDVMCSLPPDSIGGRLRRGLRESREPEEHPEDRCEECRREFDSWFAPTPLWAIVTGLAWCGPIVCEPCFWARLRARLPPYPTATVGIAMGWARRPRAGRGVAPSIRRV